MFDQNQLSLLKEKLKTASSFLLLLPSEPDTDSLAAALSLHLSLKQNGKTSQVGCTSPVKVGDSHLFGIDQVKNNIGSQNLVISFDYQEDAAENVSYDIDEQAKKFNLRIKPKAGAKPLDTQTISYSYTGADADLVFIFGVNSLEELGRLYSEEKSFLDDAQTVSLNLTSTPSAFASINLNTNKPTSLSEAMTGLLKATGINLTADAATNLYNQVIAATNNFTNPRITADTFEVAAFLLRSGAQKTTPKPPAAPSAAPTFFTQPQPPVASYPPKDETENRIDRSPKNIPGDWTVPKIFRNPQTSLK